MCRRTPPESAVEAAAERPCRILARVARARALDRPALVATPAGALARLCEQSTELHLRLLGQNDESAPARPALHHLAEEKRLAPAQLPRTPGEQLLHHANPHQTTRRQPT